MKAIAIIALLSDGPNEAASIIAKSKAGNANPKSANLIIISSTTPPIAEAVKPRKVPIAPPKKTAQETPSAIQ